MSTAPLPNQPTLERQAAYWRQRLSGQLPVLELPMDNPRPPVSSFVREREMIVIGEEAAQKLKKFCTQHNLSPFVVLLAALKILLFRYTGEKDVIVGGITNSYQYLDTHKEKDKTWNNNPVAFRTDLSGDPTVSVVLSHVAHTVQEAVSNGEYPFHAVMQDIGREGLRESFPFRIMLYAEGFPTQIIPIKKSDVQDKLEQEIIGQCDLVLKFFNKEKTIVAHAAFDAELFESATMSRMLGHYQNLLESMVTEAGKRLSDLTLLTKAEHHQFLVEWNQTAVDYPRDKCIHQVFEAQVARTPEAIAVVFEEQQLTYRKLNERANQLAHFLQGQGVGSDVRVGICLERGLELIISLLGILKAGGAYVPLDPTYPKERLHYMVNDATPQCIVTQHGLVQSLEETDCPRIYFDEAGGFLAQYPFHNPVSANTGLNLAYLIYTSGSTGRPKGVMVPHEAVVNLLLTLQERIAIDATAVVLAITNYSFDMSVFELLGTLIAGSRMVLTRREVAMDVAVLLSVIESHGITVLQATPTFWRMFLQASQPTPTGSLKIISGGEPLTADLARRLQPWGYTIWNAYGPTETTIWSTIWEVKSPDDRIPIGRPLANTAIFLVDKAGELGPIGVPGEILIGGDGVTRGYQQRPDLTAKKFIPDPFSHSPGKRLYKTGDLARYRLTGDLEYLKRLDHQVKLRGFRIELGEIEKVLGHHPGVQNAVVLCREDSPGEKQLVAYVILEHEKEMTQNDLRKLIKDYLPEYMIPSRFIILDHFPLTANQKVDRHALPWPAPDRPTLVTNYLEPRIEMESILVNIWEQILEVSPIGIQDNFFFLGGHSLWAVQIAARARELHGWHVPVSIIMTHPTVETLAAALEQTPPQKKIPDGPVLQAFPRTDAAIPLSTAQERVWFLEHLYPGQRAYHFQTILRMSGPLKFTALEQALNEMVRRHEILRTTFQDISGKPSQIIHDFQAFPLVLEDFEGILPNRRVEALHRRIQEEMERLFDLTKLPLIRWRLMKLTSDCHILLHIEHHLVHDGWSFRLYLRELFALYTAFANGRSSPLSDLPLQFADFAIWERQWLKTPAANQQLAYWKSKLAGCPRHLSLPTDRSRPDHQTFTGAAPRIEIPPPLAKALIRLSQQKQVTLFHIMFSAFVILLSRHTGESDLCVGTGFANRETPQTERLLGMFVNNVVLRAKLTGNPPFDELLRRVRDLTLEAFARTTIPFDHVVRELQLEPNLGRNPLFQVMFNFHDAPMPEVTLPGMTLEMEEIVSNQTAKFDLSVIVIPYLLQNSHSYDQLKKNNITVIWEYNMALFDQSTIERLIGHYHGLLKSIVADPTCPINHLPFLTESEWNKLLVEWNQTAANYPGDSCIHQLFEDQVALAPETVGVVFGDCQVTYGELNRSANRLAHHLQKLGVGPEIRVGVCLERHVDLIVSLLAILKAGGAYVPLDPEYPTERLEFMLQDTALQVLITQSDLSQRLPNPGQVVCLDEDPEIFKKGVDQNPVRGTQAGNLAYVMYTSGSTGRPKGVCVEHRAVIRLVRGTSFFTFSSKEVYLQLAPLAFDASTFEIWGALLNGASLVILPERQPSLDEIGGAIHQYQVTTLWLTADLFHVMVSERIEALKPLRHLLAGGDKLSAPHVEKARRELNGCRLVNGYGPTEGTTFSCCYEVPLEENFGDTVPIGRPISNTTIYILNAHQQPVPIGVRGELYIGGDGLAREYWNRPELTAAKFVPHPFNNQAGARLYQTGDWARYRQDGNIEFLGRRDHQVKIRGYRIELGEIEATLEQQESVRQAIVLAQETALGDKQLVAYIIPANEQAPASGELGATLAARLPDYMIPNLYVLLEAFPLTPNGKVDSKALPPPVWKKTDRTETTVILRTHTEQKLAEIWCQLLGLEKVTIHDHFFYLGGHSLLAMRLTSRIHLVFGVNLPISEIFEAPTLEALAKRIQALPIGSDPLPLPPLTEQVSQTASPASYAQERMWFLQQSTPTSAVYNQSFVLRVQGNLQVEALQCSLQALEERHEPLRTTFALAVDRVEQYVQPTSDFSLTLEDLRPLPPMEREGRLWSFTSQEASRLFNLSRGPLWRGRLVRLGDKEHVLLLTFHHICMDEWSLRTFREELSDLYAGFAVGRAVKLPPLPCRYIDYAQWQRQWMESRVAKNQLEYWRTKLGNKLSALNLPTDYPRLSGPNERGATERRLLSASLLERLKKLSGENEMTLFMTLLGAFQVLLYRYTGQDDVVVGTPIANRDSSKFQGLIGLFLNTMVMRCDLSGQPTVREMLTRVRKMALEAFAHRDVPFEKVVQAVRGLREGNTAPLFQVMFVLKNLKEHAMLLDSLETTLSTVSTGTAKFDLTLFLEAKTEGLQGMMEYRTDLFEAETIQRMLGNLEVLLEGIVTDPEKRIGELPLLAESQCHQALVEWNQTTADYPSDRCIHQLVEEQVAQTPDAVALVFEDCHVTYRELNCRANRLARHLQTLGVGPEVRVGLCVERSMAMVIGLLGILKAGGVYVPLDPGHPKERLAFMLQDVQPAVVLTNQGLDHDHDWPPFRTVLIHEILANSEVVHNPSCLATPQHLAYLLFTSGSTGQSKAVALQHQTLVNLVTWQNIKSRYGAGGRTLQFSSLNFDVSLQEIFTSLCGGGTLLLIGEKVRRDLSALVHLIYENRVTRIFSPLALLEYLIQALNTLETPPTWLREVVTAGEQLRITSSVVKMFEWLSETILVNQYGPTEAHVVSEYTLRGPPSEWMLLPPIGRPIWNTQLYILDDGLNPVPIGVQGELYIGGEGLARGYWNRPELTALKFTPHPFNNHPGARLYKTGDWARYRTDGNIEFLGRRDDQVKIRGYRIELGEIEAVLEQQELVKQAIVLARETALGDKQLVAYVIPAKDRTPTSGELREALVPRLPDYMLPTAIVMLDEFPLTPNGKINRRGLPPPNQTHHVQSTASIPPKTPLEEVVAEAWRDVLKLEKVGIHDNFFELGGHSLLATQLIVRLNQQAQIDLPLRTLFDCPILADQARAIEDLLLQEITHLTDSEPDQHIDTNLLN